MNKIKKALYLLIGIISLGLGCIGIILPILPTVPFLLLTSFCFVRGSKKFNCWFLNTRIYKNHLDGFVKTKSMTIKKEIILLMLVTTMLFISMWFVNSLVMSIVITVLITFKYLFFIFYVKTISKEDAIKMKENGYAR